METIPATALRPYMVRLVKLLASWKPHFSCAQQLLAERMITIVAHFCTRVVKFIFGGRNSGQNAGGKRKERLSIPLKVTNERVNFRLTRNPGSVAIGSTRVPGGYP
jgi:hypothetical protein